MYQVYCNDENGINAWLAEYHDTVEIVDFKMSMNEQGEYIMVIYKNFI